MNALVYLNAYRWKYIILDYTGGRETENMYIFQDGLLIESIKSYFYAFRGSWFRQTLK